MPQAKRADAGDAHEHEHEGDAAAGHSHDTCGLVAHCEDTVEIEEGLTVKREHGGPWNTTLEITAGGVTDTATIRLCVPESGAAADNHDHDHDHDAGAEG